ncbi:alpha-N-arabinofuranosidase [Maritimibacter sp. UBA3975]|uniref:arabinosylfuranosidase ArfA n=1 Tax=Maritimibacter sp. UBA3975 TaxID=1946833 RepID=UPI000C0A329A|nr:alpha-N-arabinofuranosidase [Maritimibacter sp. UBA3975]MAM62950.1 alpha-N-arabinofuranosidase [Maritimibacter sp.]|tara:strand:+ start:29909 stop:31411 length:1503 start_codon:yes stop_codon:yes gene_type:complete
MRARATAHADFVVGEIDPRLYGSFIEHLGRAVYSGIYEPGHETADENGFRGDVLDLVRELDVPVVRYPGGNFVSAYNWEDGIGPKEGRPVRLDLAWHTSESNEVGIHEFADWAEAAGTEMMLAVNLGSRGLDEARAFVEYVNHPGGTYWSDLRRENGREAPWGVKMWCLGNEMDGPWQIGQKTADEYGRIAFETAKALRAYDKSLELVVCGSSTPNMATYPEWEATVLDYTYDSVDFISLHMYFENHAGDLPEYLSLPAKLDDYIATVAGILKMTKAKKRSKRDVYISFDEWNVWYHSREQDRATLEGNEGWPFAPPLLEDIYDFADVLQVGAILNTFIRRSDVVKVGCLAQLVNVIAPIMTVKGGTAWRQTTFWPYYFASRYGRGTALNLAVDCPGYDSQTASDVPYLDLSAVVGEDGVLTVFCVNRHESEAVSLAMSLEGLSQSKVVMDKVIAGHELDATNGPDGGPVAPVDGNGAAVNDGRLTAELPPLSYRMIRLG